MRVFCDTSVLVAASIEAHTDHAPAKAALQRVVRGDDIGHVAAHSLAETFSVLSRIPTRPKLYPRDVLAILESNIFPYFVLLGLPAEEYPESIRALATKGFGGGRIYDFLLLRVASKLALDRIYTFNDAEWKILAPDLSTLIWSPPRGL